MTAKALKEINAKYPVLIAHMIEDSIEYLEEVKEVLRLNGIVNMDEFHSPEEYEDALRENPTLLPDIALVDYRFDSSVLTGMDILRNLIQRTRNKRVKPKVIMVTNWDNPNTITEFFHGGGFGWIFKNRSTAKEDLKERIQSAATEIISVMENRAFLEELKEIQNHEQ